MSITISNNGNLNIINSTFDNFYHNNVLMSIANSKSNMDNVKFLNMELAPTARQTGFIATYTGSGNHVIKNTIFNNLVHNANSRLLYSWAVLYVNSGSASLEMDNVTMRGVYSISESLIRSNGVLNVKNSKFIDNNVRKYQQGTRYYVGTSLFYNNNGKLSIETSLIENNTGSTYLIYHNGGNSVSNINYNAIYDNTFSTGIATTTGTNNLDYNWWNAETPTYANANAWIVLDGYAGPEKIVKGDNVSLIATFNHYITKDGVRGDTNHIIPYDGNVTFILPDGTMINATTKNGEASVPYQNINGTETFTIKGNGQEVSFSVKLNTLRLDVDDSIEFGENATIKVLAPGIAANVTLIIDGVSKTVEVIDSYAETLENLKTGDHNAVVIYNDGTTFEYDSKSFSVEKVPTEIELDDITVDAGVSVPIEFTIAEDATGKVFVEVNGVKSFKELVDGTFTMDLKDLVIGNNTVVLSYSGDNKYLETSKTIKITVNALDAGLKANSSDVKVGEDAVIGIEINSDVTGDVRVLIGNEVIPVTLIDGKATIKIPN
jgi:hypothetical protein